MNRFEVGQKTATEPAVARRAAEFGFVEMDAMAEQRARAEQAEAVVDVGVARLVRIELATASRSRRGSRPDGSACSASGCSREQGARGLELRLGRGEREARRDRVELPALARASARAAPGCRDSRARGVSSRPAGAPRSIITLPAIIRVLRRSALGEERLDRFPGGPCNRPRPSWCRCAAARRGRSSATRSAWAGSREFLLLDEGVFLQPLQQLRAVGADHLGLRVVDVRCRSGRAGRGDRDSDRPACPAAASAASNRASPTAVTIPPRSPDSAVMRCSDGWRRRRPRPGRRRKVSSRPRTPHFSRVVIGLTVTALGAVGDPAPPEPAAPRA